jgi:mannose-1-phosphate guanylyltransferase
MRARERTAGAGRDRYAVVMAGGVGTRFWPRSRQRLPKQFLAIASRHTMLQETVRRLSGIVPLRRTLVVASAPFAPLIREQLPRLPEANLLVEPAARGTAACLALATERIAELNPEASMAIFPADHVITDRGGFRRVIRRGFETAENERCLVTFGIVPTHAETGYGYVQVGSILRSTRPRVHWAKRFHEKPKRQLAERYVNDGRYFWNSGMFVWRVDVIREAFARHAPQIARVFGTRMDGSRLDRAYRRLPNLSIDVAVMERSDRVAVVEADMGWSDVGSWAAMADLWGTDSDGNAERGRTIVVDCRDTVVFGEDRLVAVVGADDLIVVDSPDALLVCPKSKAQDVRRIVAALTHSRHKDLL